jgi:hypothetical protein
MANGEYEIDEETFKDLKPSQQNWLLFKTFNTDRAEVDKRFEVLEKRKLVDRTLSVGSGFVGGFMAILMKRLF